MKPDTSLQRKIRPREQNEGMEGTPQSQLTDEQVQAAIGYLKSTIGIYEKNFNNKKEKAEKWIAWDDEEPLKGEPGGWLRAPNTKAKIGLDGNLDRAVLKILLYANI
jgi:hypothetical protein